VSEAQAVSFRTVTLPFIVFTAIWGSTWIVIRGQLGIVPPQWSVTYRFVIAAFAMGAIALAKGEGLRLPRSGVLVALVLGFTQFCVNFNAVYLAERHITSGVVATVFALLLIPSSLLGWAFLGHKPTSRFFWGSLIAVAGIGLLFAHELGAHAASARQVIAGIGLTFVGMLGAAIANVLQARPEVRRFPLFTMLAWAMACGALITAVPLLAVGVYARGVMKMNYMTLCGLLAGSMTDPPALAFANSMTDSNGPSLAYATVYPLTMLLRVVSAQLLILVFGPG